MGVFGSIEPTNDEITASLPGDDLVPEAQVVMDRAFTLPGSPPTTVWPWLVQLGKGRAGWYLPASVERLVPPGRRALRRIEPSLQRHEVGDVIDDWGGSRGYLRVAAIEAPHHLAYISVRGRIRISWAIVLRPAGGPAGAGGAAGTRLHMRLRLAGVRRPWLAEHGGGLMDALTVTGLAAGLRERVAVD